MKQLKILLVFTYEQETDDDDHWKQVVQNVPEESADPEDERIGATHVLKML